MSLSNDNIQKFGSSVASYLALLCGHSPSSPNSPYYLSGEFPLPLSDFACRLAQYFACAPVCFAAACVYLRRVRDAHPALFLDDRNAHKLLLAAITVATKFCEDRQCPQAHYARCGGIEVDELNALESHFLSLLGYNAFVSPDECSRAWHELAMLDMPRAKLVPRGSI